MNLFATIRQRQVPWARRALGFIVVLALVFPAVGWTEQSQQRFSPKLLFIEDAIVTAVDGNPGLAEMQARYEALAQIPSQLGTLPDPILSLNAMNLPTDTFNVGQEAMTQMQVGISQAIPFPGKLVLREGASEYEALAAGFSVDEVRLLLIRNVKAAGGSFIFWIVRWTLSTATRICCGNSSRWRKRNMKSVMDCSRTCCWRSWNCPS